MHGKIIAGQLLDEKLISEECHSAITEFENSKPMSVHWQVKSLLYAGVSVLAAGLGMLIYKNIDYIGHNVIAVVIALIALSGYGYASWVKFEFEWEQVKAPNLGYDYVLLLASLSLVSLVGYLQFEYNLFGNRWGLATFIPFIIIAFATYYYDHLGLLSMAIVLLASWLGITVTPTELLRANDFNSTHFIYTGIALSAGLGLAAYVTKRYNLKKHFEFTYFNFALNIGFIAALSGLFVLGNDWLWYIIIALMIFYCITFALKMKSFYILIITVAYGYIALNNLLWTLMTNLNMVSAYLALFWLIFSSIMIIKYLRDIKHRFQDDSL